MTGRGGGRRFVVVLAATALGMLGLLPAAAADVDTAPPVLHGVSFTSAALTAPGRMVLDLDASDDVAIVRSDVIFFEDLSHRSLSVTDNESPLTAEAGLDTTSANGRWRVYSVRLTDAANNVASYYYDGRFMSTTIPPWSTHDVDLTGPSLTLSGATDQSAPVLTRMEVGTAARRAGESSTYLWAATDAEHAVSTIRATFRNPVTGEFASAEDDRASSGSGTLTVVAPHVGTWPVVGVEVFDTVGNSAYYRPDGRASVPGGMFPRRHDLSLAAQVVGVAPGTAEPSVVERPGRLSVVLPASVRPQLLSGIRVTARPSGVVREFPVPTGDPLVVDVAGLPNGTTQTLAVTLHSAWGDSPVATVTGRPVLSRNVTGSIPVTGGGPHDVDLHIDLLAVRQWGVGQDDAVLEYPGTGTGGVRAGRTWLPSGVGGCHQIAAFGQKSFGNAKLLCRTDALRTFTGGQLPVTWGRRGWASMRWVDGGFDLTGDRWVDVLAMNPGGDLVLYRQTSSGTLLAPVLVGRGWQSMISVVSAGDLTGDRRNDVVAVDTAGRLWLYPGTGTGTLGVRRQLATGWHTMGALLPLRDFNGDGKTDLGGITMDGRLLVYRGTGTGAVRAGVVIAKGWQVFL